jgi:hypothetical protein
MNSNAGNVMADEHEKSGVTITLDILRHLLIIGSTAYIISMIWNWNWIVALIAAVPLYIVMLNLIGFLTLPLYAFTPEKRLLRKGHKAIKAGDFETLRSVNREFEDEYNVNVPEGPSEKELELSALEDEATYIVNKLKIKMLQIKNGESVEDSEIAALEREADRVMEELEVKRLEVEIEELNQEIK